MADKRYSIENLISYPDKSFIQANIKDLVSDNNADYVIPSQQEFRLDLISYKLYGLVELKWLLIYVNNIIDLSQLKAGEIIKYPTFDEYIQFLLKTFEEQ